MSSTERWSCIDFSPAVLLGVGNAALCGSVDVDGGDVLDAEFGAEDEVKMKRPGALRRALSCRSRGATEGFDIDDAEPLLCDS